MLDKNWEYYNPCTVNEQTCMPVSDINYEKELENAIKFFDKYNAKEDKKLYLSLFQDIYSKGKNKCT